MTTETLPAVVQHHTELSVDVVIDRLGKITELMRKAMTLGVDFGVIPGTTSKPTLLKPGAEKLCLMFRLCPEYRTVKHFDGQHLTVECSCRILSQDGNFCGEANAIATTREKKWAYRSSERTCPECGKAAIIVGKAEYGGGFLCWKKKDGCGAKFPDDNPAILSQPMGRIDNPDLADTYNTVVRIAEKRAYIAAVRLVTGSSALFDEEHGPAEAEREQPPADQQQAPPKPPVIAEWKKRLEADPTVDQLTAMHREIKAMPQEVRDTAWTLLDDHAIKAGLSWNKAKQAFVRREEAA